MVARAKLKGVDGFSPPAVECAAQSDSTLKTLPGSDRSLIDKLIGFS